MHRIRYPAGSRLRQAGYHVIEKAGYPAKYASIVLYEQRQETFIVWKTQRCFYLFITEKQLSVRKN